MPKKETIRKNRKNQKKDARTQARELFEAFLDRLGSPRRALAGGALCAAALVLAIQYGYVSEADRLYAARLDELAAVRGEVAAIEQTLAERPKLVEMLREADQRLNDARALLPDETQTGALIAVINAAAERTKVMITNIDARTLTQPFASAASPQNTAPQTSPTTPANNPSGTLPVPNASAGSVPPSAPQNRPQLQLLRRPFPITVRGEAQAIGLFLAELRRARPLILVESCDLHSLDNTSEKNRRVSRGLIEANLLLSTYVVPPLATETRKNQTRPI